MPPNGSKLHTILPREREEGWLLGRGLLFYSIALSGGPMTHYTSQSSYFGLTWMTRKKSGRCERYRTYKGTIRNKGLTGLMGLRGCPVSPVSPIKPEIPDCAFVGPVPPGFFPWHPGKFLKFYSKSKVFLLGGLRGVVCRGAYLVLVYQ